MYVVAAVVTTGLLLVLAWFVGQGTPRREARRLAHIELRMLRQARDRLIEHLEQIEYQVHEVAEEPARLDSQRGGGLDPLLQRIATEGAILRRYGADGKILAETAVGAQRPPKLSDEELQTLLAWAREPSHRQATMFDVGESSREGTGREQIRFAAPIWNKGDAAPSFAGVLCLWIPSTSLLSSYLVPTHLLPESYTFAMARAGSGEGPDSSPILLWHSAEPQWIRSSGQDAAAFIAALRPRTGAIAESGEDFDILDLPRRDGTDRREVVAFTPVVFDAKHWIIGLSTPYDVAVEFSAAQRGLTIILCGLTLGVLVVGILILSLQRTRLTEQAAEHRRLLSAEHDYRELFEENPTAMLVLSDEGKVLACNHSGERLAGLPREEVADLPLVEVFEESSIGPLWATLQDRGHLHIRDTVLTRRADRTPLLVEVWGRKIAGNWVMMAHNVEQRRDLEQQVARLRRMDSIGALASTLAHDFNNLLGQVQILVSHLQSELPKKLEVTRDVAAIEQKLDDAAHLVSNLLAAKENVVSREPVWIEPVLREFAAGQPKMLPERIQFAAEIRSDLPPVWITPPALRRVLDNLCLNAVDAMPYGGILSLRAYARRVDPATATEQLPVGPYTVIELADTGSGMSRDVLESIFDPFFTTKRQGQGTGLGLWTVYRIVRAVGGWIHVRSSVGKGTQFTLYLPQSPPKPTTRPMIPEMGSSPQIPAVTTEGGLTDGNGPGRPPGRLSDPPSRAGKG